MRCHSTMAGLGLAILTLGACVSLDQLPPGSVPGAPTGAAAGQAYPDLDGSATATSGLHFTIRGYSDADIRSVMSSAEGIDSKILNDTGLYSAMSSTIFKITLYRDRDEFISKTHQASWARVVYSSGTLYTYAGGTDLEPQFTHQLSHVIFETYLGDKAASLRWLNEGMAMYEEYSKMSESDRSSFRSNQVNTLRTGRVPFSQMTFFVPSSEEQRLNDPWYGQVESVVAYLIAQGSNLNFGSFLEALKKGQDIDSALLQNYPNKFRTLSDLETAWKSTL